MSLLNEYDSVVFGAREKEFGAEGDFCLILPWSDIYWIFSRLVKDVEMLNTSG